MSDFTQTRAEYLKIMMGNQKDALSPYRPDQLNDLGDTSFDAATLGETADYISNGADLKSSLALSRQRKAQRQQEQFQKQQMQSQQEMIAEQQDDGKGEWWQQVFGFIDNIAASWGTGWVKFYEGILDLGAGIVSTIASWAGNQQMSNDINSWIEKDLASNAAEWTKTYANFTPWAVISNIAKGNYLNGEYWEKGFKSGLDIATLETTNLRGTEDLASDLKSDTSEYYNFHSGYNTEVGEFIGGVVQSIGTVVASIYGIPNIGGFKNAFGEGSLANKAVNLVPFSASASGSGMEEALNDGAERTDLALAYGLASGAVEGATELASVGLEKIPGVGKMFTGEIHGLASKGVKLTTSKFLANMFEEGFEEVESDLLNPLIKTIYKGSSALSDYNTGEYWLNVGKDFAAGAASAGVLGAVQNLQVYKDKKSEQAMVDKIKEKYGLSSDDAARAVLSNVAYAKAAEMFAKEYEEAFESGDKAKMDEITKKVEDLSKSMEATLNKPTITDEDRRNINLRFKGNLQLFSEDLTKLNSEVNAEEKGIKTSEDTKLPEFEDKVLSAKGTVEAPPSLVKEAADSRFTDVYDMSSVTNTTRSVRKNLVDALERAGIKGKIMTTARDFNKNIFNALNLGTDADRAKIREYFKEAVLNSNVRMENEDGTKSTVSLESVTTEEMREQISKMVDEAFNELLTKGRTSIVSKLADNIVKLVMEHRETKNKGSLHRDILRHAQRLFKTYGHANVWLNQTGEYDFDHKGFQVLVAPFGQIEETRNGISFSGKSVLEAFKPFLEKYQAENYQKKAGEDENIVSVSDLWNQGLRDLAIRLVDSIEKNNRKEYNVRDKEGKPTGEKRVKYDQLNSEQLYMLNQMLDIVRGMPSRSMETKLENRGNAMSAQEALNTYLINTPGYIKNFLQGYAERFSSQTDTLMFEIGDNDLSKLFYSDLIREAALRDGDVNDILGGINDYRKENGITESKLKRESSVVKDTNGKGIEMRYVETLYRHFLSGEDSNNVKYINNDTMYVYDKKGNVAHIIDFKYSAENMEAVKKELTDRGLLGYSEYLHNIDNKTLRNIYDEDYLRDFHVANSNSLDNYCQITLRSNSKEMGRAEVIGGVSNKNYQIDRVENIPKGTHLVLVDGQCSILANAKNIYNTHYLDPVLKKINGTLNSSVDGSHGKNATVRQYLTERKMNGALTLMRRMVYGAYDVTPAEIKQHKLIDGFSTNWVMYVLGLNPSTVLKQPVSIMWSNDIKLSTVLKFTIGSNMPGGRVFNNTNRLVKEIEDEFPSLKLRKSRNEALKGNTPGELTNKIQKSIGKVVGFGINWADRWTVAHEAVGLLAYQGQSLGYGEIGTPKNDQYVKDHYVMFYQTQVSSNKILMSGARSGYYGGLGKVLSLFTGPAQGQVGYILRAGQQIKQFKGKTQSYFDSETEKAKAAEREAKEAFENAERFFRETSENEDSKAEDIKKAKRSMDDAFDEYARARGRRMNLETQSKSFRHYQDLGGARGVVANRLGSAAVTGVYLSLVSFLIQILKGKHKREWEEGDLANLAKETALNSFVSWVPVVRNIQNFLSGYDLEIPEYIAIQQIYKTAQSILSAITNNSEANTKAMWRNIVNSIGMTFGIPTENIYNYLYGFLKMTNVEAALELRNLFYGVSNDSLAKTVKEYVEANDISSASKYAVYQYQMYKTGDITHEVAVELTKLMREGYNPIAKNVPDHIQNDDGEKAILSEDQKAGFKDVYSESNKVVVKLIKSSKYQSLDSESKAKTIKKVYDLYYELARYEVLKVEPNSKIGKLLAYSGGDYDILATLLLIQQNASLADTKRMSKKEQAVRLVNRQPMTKNQRLLALYLMGYGVNSENRKTLQNYLVSIGFTKQQAKDFLPS